MQSVERMQYLVDKRVAMEKKAFLDDVEKAILLYEETNGFAANDSRARSDRSSFASYREL